MNQEEKKIAARAACTCCGNDSGHVIRVEDEKGDLLRFEDFESESGLCTMCAAKLSTPSVES